MARTYRCYQGALGNTRAGEGGAFGSVVDEPDLPQCRNMLPGKTGPSRAAATSTSICSSGRQRGEIFDTECSHSSSGSS
jgi:hypothetical protein